MRLIQPEGLLAEWQRLGLPFRNPPRLLRALPGGRTNRSYLIEADNERWVLRLDSPHSVALGIDRGREQRILRAAHRAGLAPELVHVDALRGFQITAFIDGEHRRPEQMDDASLAAVLALLARVSALNADVARMNYELPELADKSLGEISESLARLEQETPAGTCHHDPVPANIIFTADRPQLIDWEYAGFGLPIIDLAALVSEWRFDPAKVSDLTQTDPQLLAEAGRCYLEMCRLWELRVSALQ
jgi:thiamine kinase